MTGIGRHAAVAVGRGDAGASGSGGGNGVRKVHVAALYLLLEVVSDQ